MPLFEISYPLILLGILVLGVVTGGLSNLTSGGAGLLTIYVLTSYAGLIIQKSTGTVLAASTVIVLVGAVSFYRRNQVNLQLGVVVGLSGVVGAFVAARWASAIASGDLEKVFGVFTLGLAGYTLYLISLDLRGRKTPLQEENSNKMETSIKTENSDGGADANSKVRVPRYTGLDPAALAIQITKGALIGVATGLFGIGLASLSVVLFIVLFRLDLQVVLGTSLVASFFRYVGG